MKRCFSSFVARRHAQTPCQLPNLRAAAVIKDQKFHHQHQSLLKPHAFLSAFTEARNLWTQPTTFSSRRRRNDRSLGGLPTTTTLMTLQRRTMSSWFPVLDSLLPSFWGHSGTLLKLFHMDGAIPYWACFALLNILVRLCLFPVVIRGAHTSAKVSQVMPEIQFVATLLTQDLRNLAQRGAPLAERMHVMRVNLKSLSLLYKKYQVHPLSVFASPLLQLPIFWYVSVDLRKMVNGLDPALAQELVEGGVGGWFPDLTEPDPWYGLSVMCGVLLYANVETALGTRALVGGAASKANSAVLVKDIFQCVAVFMPCFTSQMPAGVQIYVATTFCFTAIQSELLRTAQFRIWAGLPPLPGTIDRATGEPVPKPPPKYASEFLRLKQLEQEAIQLRGSGPLLGRGVLKTEYQGSFAGRTGIKTTIVGSGVATPQQILSTVNQVDTASGQATLRQRDQVALEHLPFGKLPFRHGISAPLWQQQEQASLFLPKQDDKDKKKKKKLDDKEQEEPSLLSEEEERIARANRGEPPIPIRFASRSSKGSKRNNNDTLNPKRFQKSASATPKHKKKKKGFKKR